MKTTKSLLRIVIASAMIVIALFAITSCEQPHEHSYTSVVTDPTCTDRGFTTHTCSCGDVVVDTYVPSTGHTYTDSVTEPTCTAQGYTTHTCSCGDTKTDTYVAAIGHSYQSEIIREPSAAEDGIRRWTCTNAGCNHSYDEDIPYEAPAHTHSYTSVVTAPTCTEQGYTTHTCACNHSYVDSYVAAKGHNYKSKITKEPTATETGIREYYCTVAGCGHTYEEPVESLGTSIPSVAEILIAIFGKVDYTIKVENGSDILLITQVDGNDNYTLTKQYIAVKVGEINVNTKSETAIGYIKLEFGVLTLTTNDKDEELVIEDGDFDAVAKMDIAVVGDMVDFTITDLYGNTNAGEDKNVNEIFYTEIAKIIGADYETLVSIIDAAEKVNDYLPVIEEIIALLETIELPEADENYIAALNGLVTALPEEILASLVDDDGNTVYTLNITAIADFINEISDGTMGDRIDGAYGDGTTEAISDFIEELPYMTIKEIADSAIALAEAYDISVDEVYGLIESVIYLASGIEVDIEANIESKANVSISEIIANAIISSLPKEDTAPDGEEEFIEEMSDEEELEELMLVIESKFEEFAELIPTLTIDQLYNLLMYGDADFTPDQAESAFSIIAMLCGMISEADKEIDLEFTVDENGNLVDLDAYFEGSDVTVNKEVVDNKTTYTADISDEYRDYLDFTLELVDGEITLLDLSVSGNTTLKTQYAELNEDGTVKFDEDTKEPILRTVEEIRFIENLIKFTYSNVTDEDGNADGSIVLSSFAYSCDVYYENNKFKEAIFNVEPFTPLEIAFATVDGATDVNIRIVQLHIDVDEENATDDDGNVSYTATVKVYEKYGNDITEHIDIVYEELNGTATKIEFSYMDSVYINESGEVYNEEYDEWVNVTYYSGYVYGELFHLVYTYADEENGFDAKLIVEIFEAEFNEDYSKAELVLYPAVMLNLNYAIDEAEDTETVTLDINDGMITLGVTLDNTIVDDAITDSELTVDFVMFGDDYIDFSVKVSDRMLTDVECTIRGYYTVYRYEDVYFDGEYIDKNHIDVKEIFVDYVTISLAITENEDGTTDANLVIKKASFDQADIFNDENGEYIETQVSVNMETAADITVKYSVDEDGFTHIDLSADNTDIKVTYNADEDSVDASLSIYINEELMEKITFNSSVTVDENGIVTESYTADCVVDGKDDVLDFELLITDGIVYKLVCSNSAISYLGRDITDENGDVIGKETIAVIHNLFTVKYINDYEGNLTLHGSISNIGISFETSVDVNEDENVTETITVSLDRMDKDYSPAKLTVIITDGEVESVAFIVTAIYEYYDEDLGYDLTDYFESAKLTFSIVGGEIENFALIVKDYYGEIYESGRITYEQTEDGFEFVFAFDGIEVNAVKETDENGAYTVTVTYELVEFFATGSLDEDKEFYYGTFENRQYTFDDLSYTGSVYLIGENGGKIFFALDDMLHVLDKRTLAEAVAENPEKFNIDAYKKLRNRATENGYIEVSNETVMLMMELLGTDNRDDVCNYMYYYEEWYYVVQTYTSQKISGSGSIVLTSK